MSFRHHSIVLGAVSLYLTRSNGNGKEWMSTPTVRVLYIGGTAMVRSCRNSSLEVSPVHQSHHHHHCGATAADFPNCHVSFYLSAVYLQNCLRKVTQNATSQQNTLDMSTELFKLKSLWLNFNNNNRTCGVQRKHIYIVWSSIESTPHMMQVNGRRPTTYKYVYCRILCLPRANWGLGQYQQAVHVWWGKQIWRMVSICSVYTMHILDRHRLLCGGSLVIAWIVLMRMRPK